MNKDRPTKELFDELRKEYGTEIGKINFELNEGLAQMFWNKAIEEAAKVAEKSQGITSIQQFIADEIRKLKV